jgi:serine/threonine protein phosphatase PrpC
MKKINKEISFTYASFKGLKRHRNKDGILKIKGDSYYILGVFDGVSSAAGAKKGVTLAVNYIKKKHSNYLEEGKFLLAKMMMDVNSHLVRSGIEAPYTTYSVVYAPLDFGADALISSLGDSRIYAITNQYISQISFFDNDKVHSNFIDRCLGMKELLASDFKEKIYSKPEGALLICSDGFYMVMESSHINLLEAHRVLKFKKIGNVKNGLERLITGLNDDDASFVFVRWPNVY